MVNKSKKFMNKNTRKVNTRKRNTRKGKGIRSKRTMRKKNGHNKKNKRTKHKNYKRRSETGGLPSPKSDDAEKIAKLILEEEGFDDMPLDPSLGFIEHGKFVPMYSPKVLAADARMRADRLKGSKFEPDAEEAAIRAERKADEVDRKKTTRHAKPRTKKTAPHHKRHTSPVSVRPSVPPPPPLNLDEFPPLGKPLGK